MHSVDLSTVQSSIHRADESQVGRNTGKQLSTVAILLRQFLSCWCLETFFTQYQPFSQLVLLFGVQYKFACNEADEQNIFFSIAHAIYYFRDIFLRSKKLQELNYQPPITPDRVRWTARELRTVTQPGIDSQDSHELQMLHEVERWTSSNSCFWNFSSNNIFLQFG